MKDDTDVKTNIIQYADDTFIFCSGKTISESKLHLEKSIAKQTKVVKYLGVHIDCNLSFDEEI